MIQLTFPIDHPLANYIAGFEPYSNCVMGLVVGAMRLGGHKLHSVTKNEETITFFLEEAPQYHDSDKPVEPWEK